MIAPTPSREEYRARVAGGAVPIAADLVADHLTPLGAFAALTATPSAGGLGHAYLLESAVGGEKWARWSFVGLDPDAVVRAWGRRVEIVRPGPVTAIREGDPLDVLEEVLGAVPPAPGPTPLPRFWGGAVGWLGYDLVRGIERIGDRHPATAEEDAVFAVGGTLLAFDHLRQTVTVLYTPDPKDSAGPDAAYDRAVARLDDVARRLRTPVALRELSATWPTPAVPAASTFTGAAFEQAVERALEYVRAGDIIQVVLSQRLTLPRGDVDPLDVYRMLRLVNPSPYMFFLRFPEAQVAGASPEILVRKTGHVAEVRPIAGTRPRGATDADDERLEVELRADPKERAEHVMLLDLGRNDLGRIAAPGGVEVTDRMVVERYSHVMHLVSHVQAHLRPEVTAADVVRATFPAGTLSGAPKVRAMQIIEELEPARRGLYGGAIGWLGWGGNLDLAIAIRAGAHRRAAGPGRGRGRVRLRAGPGVGRDARKGPGVPDRHRGGPEKPLTPRVATRSSWVLTRGGRRL